MYLVKFQRLKHYWEVYQQSHRKECHCCIATFAVTHQSDEHHTLLGVLGTGWLKLHVRHVGGIHVGAVVVTALTIFQRELLQLAGSHDLQGQVRSQYVVYVVHYVDELVLVLDLRLHVSLRVDYVSSKQSDGKEHVRVGFHSQLACRQWVLNYTEERVHAVKEVVESVLVRSILAIEGECDTEARQLIYDVRIDY